MHIRRPPASLDQARQAEDAIAAPVALQERARTILEWETSRFRWGLLSVGLWHLAVGQAMLLPAYSGSATDFRQASHHFDEAYERVRLAGQLDYMPRFLLARAELHRLQGAASPARREMERAREIAGRFGLTLQQADCEASLARLLLQQRNRCLALKALARAEELTSQTGYHRLDGELVRLRHELTIV